ncbi:hypothetical protein JOY44_25450 (plasmid) [Phormidium sp. CLA17]|uniref:hypothetical protein n=1 Tax=Leptolyngbya sp. Cla-17 TaxID=2803751 RepID=UPI0014926F1E|nr:hypothetical protein [Leptolyngbya sp. Cla-17]MBM0744868.1 hypothetical protein [Leptolyngbya sp. Cla-17]
MKASSLAASPQVGFQYLLNSDHFLALFPHRFDYIWAEYSNPGEKVEWRTESRHLLSDRLIQQGSYLYGVRFGAETNYCLLDIDIGSLYHPKQDPFAISRILAALEPLGLVSHVACTSSYSGGLHLYFPFQQAQNSWKLAITVSTLLENAGFKIKPGQLEVFPDPKPYNVNGKPSLFNAHRFPLQISSYLVDQDFQPFWGTQQSFVQQWQIVQARNDVEALVIRRILKQAKRHQYAVSTKAEKFINDLNAEIELGWTDFGQTNYLLGRIAMREYIFRHVLTGGKPLVGDALVNAIVDIARSLPDYSEYCRHCHEIEHRAQEWARCIENSRYFHYGDAVGKFKAKSDDIKLNNPDLDLAIAKAPTWNQQQSESARDRIRRAIAELLDQDALPANATSRFHALVNYGIGGGTLYNHRDLWHPNHLVISLEPVENPPYPPTSNTNRAGDCFEEASPAHSSTSLFPSTGSNHLTDKGSSDLELQNNEPGRNSFLAQAPSNDASALSQDTSYVQQVLFEIKASQEARLAAVQMAYEQQQQIKRQASESRHVARMQQFLDSGDPILMAEAIAWAQVNPGVLDTSLTVRSSPSGDLMFPGIHSTTTMSLSDSSERPESFPPCQIQTTGSSTDRDAVVSPGSGVGLLAD